MCLDKVRLLDLWLKTNRTYYIGHFMTHNLSAKLGKVTANESSAQVVNVAVAVIHYQQHYLLGYRNASQHQGDRYEFVGGKIDTNETAQAALIREVSEEVAIDISGNSALKLGRLHHDYGDKQVCLHVYKVELSAAQYQQHKGDDFGPEGQALVWVDKADLLENKYNLPAANTTILAWLRLPKLITITYPLAHFATQLDSCEAWLRFHQQNIANNAWVYVRLKDKQASHFAALLLQSRSDIMAILPVESSRCINSSDTFETTTKKTTTDVSIRSEDLNYKSLRPQLAAYHLNHAEVLTWFDSLRVNYDDNKRLYIEQPLILSCHDVQSIQAANAIAKMRLQQHLPPVIGIFLSPVLATHTHPDDNPLGWRQWSTLAQLADIPVIALGGLYPNMYDLASTYGAVSIAGIRQFLHD